MIRGGTALKNSIYLDYQATTPVDPRVIESISKYFYDCPGNPHSEDHAWGWAAAEAVDAATHQIAGILGCDADEVVFTSGATEANNLAILGLAARTTRRRRIVISAIEHKSVLAAAHAAQQRFQCTVDIVPVDAQGIVKLDALETMLTDDVLLVSIMSLNSEIGSIQPIAQIADVCARVGALFHTDAAQAVPMDLCGTNGPQLLSMSAHKMYGPKGVGLLRVDRDIQAYMEPLIYGGGQQHGLRSGTLPVPLIVGFGEALRLVCSPEGTEERKRIAALRDDFVTRLMELSNRVFLNGPPLSQRHPGNCNLRFGGIDGRDLLARLQPRLAASTGSACASGIPEPSHVLTAMGLSEVEARSSVRFSFGRFSTNADIDGAVETIGSALASM